MVGGAFIFCVRLRTLVVGWLNENENKSGLSLQSYVLSLVYRQGNKCCAHAYLA